MNCPDTPKKQRKYIAPVSPLTLSAQFQPSPLTPKLTHSESEHYFENKFDQSSKIGEGSFSKVFKARHIETNHFYAIKISKREITNKKQMDRAIREIKAVKNLSHPHVLKYIFAWMQNRKLYIQTDFCEHGTLSQFVQNWITENPLSDEGTNGVYLKERVIWNYFVDLLLGIHHIHTANLLHLDIKPANIFIDSNHRLIIGDFGLTIKRKQNERIIDKSKNSQPKIIVPQSSTPSPIVTSSSFHFIPPLERDEDNNNNMILDDYEDGDAKYLAKEALNGNISEATDIFSLGITLFELATLYIEIPQNGKNWEYLRNGNITSHSEFPPHYSTELKKLIDDMTNPNVSLRPTATDLLSHKKVLSIISERIRDYSNDIEYINSLPEFFFDAKSDRDIRSSKRMRFSGNSLPSSFKSILLSQKNEEEQEELTTPPVNNAPPLVPSPSVNLTPKKLNFFNLE